LQRLGLENANYMDAVLEQFGFLQKQSILTVQDCSKVIHRLHGIEHVGKRDLIQANWCVDLAETISSRLKLPLEKYIPIQCTLFQKTPQLNWLVPWHQDRSLPVKAVEPHEVPARIIEKDNTQICQPSAKVLEKTLAIRVHLDSNNLKSGPLKILPGTHKKGILSKTSIEQAKQSVEEHVVLGEAGSVLVMRPLLLHASSKALHPNGRKVLHFLYVER